MDVIALSGIVAHGKHGANPGERDREQPFDVEVKLELDLSRGQLSDDLAQTINYAELHAAVVRIVREHSYVLLERLAGVIVDEIFRDPRIFLAEVRIGKPNLLDGATPSVTLRRTNPRFVAQFP